MSKPTNISHSKWPFRLALLLCCATFPLIWVGGLVTTYDAGMAVPDWPSTYGYNMFLYPVSTWWSGPFDLFIEHGHRLLGSLTGIITIALVAVTWAYDERRYVRWFSVACLVGVIVQGLIGGFRVLANEIVIARLHGCTGPLFFCMTVAMVIFTSRRWREKTQNPTAESSSGPFRVAAILTVIAFGQLVLGSFIRHIPVMTTPNEFRGMAFAHLFVALGVATYAFMLWRATRKSAPPATSRVAGLLTLLVLCQICLGIGTWFVKYNWPTWLPAVAAFDRFVIEDKGMLQGLVTTAHVAMGSLILATSFAISIVCCPVEGIRQALLRWKSDSSKSKPSNHTSVRMEAMA